MLDRAALLLWLVCLLSSPAVAQDLFDRDKAGKEPATAKKTFTPERVELSTSAPLINEKNPQGNLQVGLQAGSSSSLLCGRFDAFAGIRDLVTDDLSSRGTQMLLDIAEGELVGNGMTLLCQASPTLCDVLKHYRFSAQALLQLNYDKCRAIDDALGDARAGLHAEAFRGCLKAKLEKGVSLPRAMSECETEAAERGFKNLGGQFVKRIDLNEELDSLFGKDGASPPILSKLILTPQGVRGQINVNSVETEYLTKRDDIRKQWDQVIERQQRGENITTADLAPLVPEWTGYRVSKQDLAGLASVDPLKRNFLLTQLATDLAILDLAKEIQEYDRRLAVAALKARTAEGTPAELAKQWEVQRAQLRESLEELLKTRQIASMANAAYSEFLQRVQQHQLSRAKEALQGLAKRSRTYEAPPVGRSMYGLYKHQTGAADVKIQSDLLERIARKNAPAPKTQPEEPCCEPGSLSWGEGVK